VKLSEAKQSIHEALQRLADSPREHRCYVIVEEISRKGHFVQFCTPPPPSRFKGSQRLSGPEPLIFDGHGDGKVGGYKAVQVFCDIDLGVAFALEALAAYLPEETELIIVEESTQRERPS